MKVIRLFYAFTLGLVSFGLQAKWADPTAGVPLLDTFSARDMGMYSGQWFVSQDSLGRLFVGANGLFVFDGVKWRRHPVGDSLAVTGMQSDGTRLWVGGAGELGYFEEPSVGNFQYHSLVNRLPENERTVDVVRGIALVDSTVYFATRHKLYAWDGATFRSWHYPGEARLFMFTLQGETWIHHVESGLYRLTRTGPQREFAPDALAPTAILGLGRDAHGLLLVTSTGFYRPGTPAQREFGGGSKPVRHHPQAGVLPGTARRHSRSRHAQRGNPDAKPSGRNHSHSGRQERAAE